jgi:hypothetical protein
MLAGAGVASMTLMACYGAPPCDHNEKDGGTGSGLCHEDPPADAGKTDAGADAGTDAGG